LGWIMGGADVQVCNTRLSVLTNDAKQGNTNQVGECWQCGLDWKNESSCNAGSKPRKHLNMNKQRLLLF
jgi:hypothetical protein